MGEGLSSQSLRVTFVGLGLVYPPLPRFSGTQLADLYATIRKRHDFEDFTEHLNEGATIKSEGVREIDIRRERIVAEESNSRPFDQIKRDIADIIDITKESLEIPLFFVPRVELRAYWHLSVDGIGARTWLQSKALKISDEQIDLLQVQDLHAVGIHIDADVLSDNHLHLDIKPSSNDANALYLRMRNVRHDRVDSAADVERMLQESYDYLSDRVTAFVEGIMS